MAYTKINHIIIPLVSCLILCITSCTSDQEPDTMMAELKFALQEDTSRSVATNNTNFKSQAFTVFGDMTFIGDSPTSSTNLIFDGETVSYDDSKGEWTYGGVQYWFPRFEYSFIAIHPGSTSSLTYSDATVTLTSYTLPDNYDDTTDIMAATHRRKYQEYTSSPAPVSLGFFHILSRVNFQVKNDGAADRIKVTQIKLEGVNKTGTFTIAPAPLLPGSGQSDDYVSSWTGISNPGTINANNISVEIPEDEERPLFPDNNALLVIPQPDNHGVIMSITYTRYDEGNDDETLTLTAETPIGGWEYGKVYTYSFSISEITTDIYLTVNVKPWQTPTATGINVPES